MDDWVRIEPGVLRLVHDEQLAEHGGAAGIRDEGLFESALARPQHLAHCGQPDSADLAAAYGFGLERKHPFVDGNKRTAFVAMELFLDHNGLALVADDVECVLALLAMAEGTLDEAGFADRIRRHARPR